MAHLRKTRCLIGHSTFVGRLAGEHIPDSIGSVGDFRVGGRQFEIPAGILYRDDYPNILTAGRIVSAEGDGWEITRVIPTAALTGQAAGIMASLMIKNGQAAANVEIDALQKQLIDAGVRIHL